MWLQSSLTWMPHSPVWYSRATASLYSNRAIASEAVCYGKINIKLEVEILVSIYSLKVYVLVLQILNTHNGVMYVFCAWRVIMYQKH